MLTFGLKNDAVDDLNLSLLLDKLININRNLVPSVIYVFLQRS